MTITQHISIDLQQPGNMPMVHAVQGDEYTRKVEIDLYSGGVAWNPPSGCEVVIKYGKPDGKVGVYGNLPDGTTAWSIEVNTISVILAPQMLTVPGIVNAQAQLIVDGKQIVSTFHFSVNVEEDSSKGAVKSENYVNWKTYYIPQTKNAKVGEFLQIAEVDADGRIVKVVPVDNPADGAVAVANDALQIARNVAQEMEDYSPSGTRSIAEAAMRMASERLVAPPNASVGQYFRVAAVDANGNVTAVEAVDAPAGGDTVTGEQIAQAVSDYLEENPVEVPEVDLTGYAKETWVQEGFQPKGNYALVSQIPTVPTKISAFTNDAGYLQHQDVRGKADKTGLSLGIHTDGLVYLFVDGAPVGTGIELGGDGIPGYIAEDGTIVLTGLADGEHTVAYKMDDGSIVVIGKPVVDNKVYYSITNTLTNCVSSNSATEAIKGEGYAATITANDGYELSSVVVTMGGEDISADVVSGGTITIGSVTGNIVVTAVAGVAAVKVINQLPISINADGTPFVGTNGEQGYKTNARLSVSSGGESAATGLEVTGYFPVKYQGTVYLRGITVSSSDTKQTVVWYDANFAKLGGCYTGEAFGDTTGEVVSAKLVSSVFNNYMTSAVAWMRITAGEITADSVITVDQEITADTVVS